MNSRPQSGLLLLLSASSLFAGEILLPAPHLERDSTITAVYRTTVPATGKGVLSVRWTDVHGRVVEHRKVPFVWKRQSEVPFQLDLRRAVAMSNDLRVHLSLPAANLDEEASITFIARPPDPSWWDYQILMWHQHSAEKFERLKRLGISAGLGFGNAPTVPEFLLNADLRWYVENMATDYYAEYHRWRPDKTQNWSFLQALELYRKDPSSKEAFKRNPSFSDPAWRDKIRARLAQTATRHAPYRPVFYSLADEPGIADLSQFWDFDFSDASLAEMRGWLRQRYGSLAALNAQWRTSFASWDAVTPQTTAEAMKRADGNFSSWADHKEWMDVSFARALSMGADAIRSVDTGAYVSIGGAQMPGWGGYDYARLARVLTAIEPYNIGNNIEVLRSLNPQLAVATTSFATGPWEKHRVWYEVLHGGRGLILWDDKSEYVTDKLEVGLRGKEAEPYYNELRRGIATLLMNSERLHDPIAIHYSQSSMRTDWMLSQKPKGQAWIHRKASTERLDSDFMRARESWCRLLEDLGLQHRFVSYDQLETGELLRGRYRLLVLPRSISMSAQEAAAIREFVDRGGSVMADLEPGEYDEHSRRLPKPQLAELFRGEARSRAILMRGDILNYHQHRVLKEEAITHAGVARILAGWGIRPSFAVTDGGVGIETHTFRNGAAHIVALHSNPQLRIHELGPPDFKSNARFEQSRAVKLTLPSEMYVIDVRAAKPLGRIREFRVTVDPYEPSIYAVSPEPWPLMKVAAPASIRPGQTAAIRVTFDALTPAETHVFHVEVIDPAGKAVLHYSGNLLAARGAAMKQLSFALNDRPGQWRIRVRDVLSGHSQTVSLRVE